MDELITKSACEVAQLLKAGEISVNDTLVALEARIDAVDGEINALPTRCFGRARDFARGRDFSASLLGGLPVAIKDLEEVAGVRSTHGSMVYENHVPQQSDLLVEHIEDNGGIVYAKSNTPEFGSGANTFNDVFGATRNPYDLNLSVAGSSGGAAAALASGTAWLAQGSDLGGSLRTPASFCGVTSLRPSPGLIASTPGSQPFDVYSQKGPMARNLADLALFADAMTGSSALAGLGKNRLDNQFQNAARQPQKPARVAYSSDLGIADTTPEVALICEGAMTRLGADCIEVEEAHPDLGLSHLAFDGLRALGYALSYESNLERIAPIIKPENLWNIRKGMELNADDILSSMRAQSQVFQNATRFMQDYGLLICPASIMTPFPVEERYPGYSKGLEYSEYYRWLAIVYSITVTTLPVITIPCGKTRAGLPVGIQLIGKAHGEADLFTHASYLEQLFDWDPLQFIKRR